MKFESFTVNTVSQIEPCSPGRNLTNFCDFFVKSSKIQNELNMMNSGDKDIELCSVDRT